MYHENFTLSEARFFPYLGNTDSKHHHWKTEETQKQWSSRSHSWTRIGFLIYCSDLVQVRKTNWSHCKKTKSKGKIWNRFPPSYISNCIRSITVCCLLSTQTSRCFWGVWHTDMHRHYRRAPVDLHRLATREIEGREVLSVQINAKFICRR